MSSLKKAAQAFVDAYDDMDMKLSDHAAAIRAALVSDAPAPVGLPAGEQTAAVVGASTLREAAQQALEALEYIDGNALTDDIAAALRAALAKPAGEPTIARKGCHYTAAADRVCTKCGHVHGFSSLPQRKPLSDATIDAMWRSPMSADWEHREFARAIEQAHGIGGEA
jgi:hypothetical protein